MLRADAGNFVLSEPFLPINLMLHAPDEFAGKEWRDMTRAAVLTLGSLAPKAAKHFFVKLFNGSVLQLPLIREAVPGVAEVFIYRDPVEVVVSLLTDPSPLPWLWFPSMTGLPKSEAAECPLVELAARVVGRLLAAMGNNLQERTLLLNYNEIGPRTPERLRHHFHLGGDERAAAAMISCLGANSKQPAEEYVSDTAKKQAAATRAIRDAVAIHALGPYLRLESLRVGSGATGRTLCREMRR